MAKFLFFIILVLMNCTILHGADVNYGLSAEASALETQSLSHQFYSERLLILWILKPSKHPSQVVWVPTQQPFNRWMKSN
jgi:hypothetical protein